jgi:hypothetical protein
VLFVAIYHCSAKVISRSTGRSAVGASAYRSGEKLYNEYDGITHDYTNKNGIEYSEVMLCENAPKEYQDRATLWNAVEKIEKAKNSQLAREVEVSLPKELDREAQIKLVKEYINDNFIKQGMCADVSLHDKGDGNPHAHIMLTMRPINPDGTWGAKSIEEKILDNNGQVQRRKAGRILSRKVNTTNWNDKETLLEWRENWAKKANEYLKQNDIKQSIDHRSYKEQGKEQVPTIHEGAVARKIEKRGNHRSNRVLVNESRRKQNEFLEKWTENITEAIEFVKNARTEEIKQPTLTTQNKPSESLQTEINVRQQELSERALGEKIRTYKDAIRGLTGAREDMQMYENRIRQLDEQKQELRGLFKGKGKKEIDKEINGVIGRLENVEKELKTKYNIDRSQLDKTLDKFTKDLKELEPKRESISERLARAREKSQEYNKEHTRSKSKSHGIER